MLSEPWSLMIQSPSPALVALNHEAGTDWPAFVDWGDCACTSPVNTQAVSNANRTRTSSFNMAIFDHSRFGILVLETSQSFTSRELLASESTALVPAGPTAKAAN